MKNKKFTLLEVQLASDSNKKDFMQKRLSAMFSLKRKFNFKLQTGFTKIVLGLLITVFMTSPFIVYALPSMSEIENSIKENKNASAQVQAEVRDLSSQVSFMNSQIANTQISIDSLNRDIVTTQQDIFRLSEEIKISENKIVKNKENLKKLVQLLYEQQKTNTFELLASAGSITDIIDAEEHNRSIEDKVNSTIAEVKASRDQLDKQKSDQEKKINELQAKRNEIQAKIDLQQTQRDVTSRLLAQSRAEKAGIEQNLANLYKIKSEISASYNQGSGGVSNSGSDLTILNNASYHYYQTSYSGYIGNSRYTISGYGCALTSVAMVATAAGNPISPATIAASPWLFDGALIYWGAAANFSGIRYLGSASKNNIDYQLSRGNYVVAKLWVTTTGYTGTHYVVISGKANGKYIVQDPAFRSGGYSFSQVLGIQVFGR